MSTHNKPSTQTDGKAMPELRLSVSLDPTSLQTLAVLLIDELQRLLTAHQPPASPQPPPTSTPPIKTQPDGRMDTKNAAIYLGMSRKTLEAWRSGGKEGPRFIKSGNKVFYYQQDLNEWLQGSGKCISTAQAALKPSRRDK